MEKLNKTKEQYKDGIALYEKFGFKVEIEQGRKFFTLYFNHSEWTVSPIKVNKFTMNHLKPNEATDNIIHYLIMFGSDIGRRNLRKQIKELLGLPVNETRI